MTIAQTRYDLLRILTAFDTIHRKACEGRMTKFTKFRSATCALVIAGIMAGSCGAAFAQTTTTTIPGRTLQPFATLAQPGGNSSAASPGCNSQTFQALGSSSNFSYAQGYAATYSLVHQPTTYFGCLQGMLGQAQSLLNMFNGTGSLTSIFSQLFTKAITSLLTTLSNQACAAVGSALNAASGGPSKNLLSYMNSLPGTTNGVPNP